MLAPVIDAELVTRVAATTGLTDTEARRVVEEVLDWYGESVEQYVGRRHRELKLRGRRNPEIFERVAAELTERLVAAPPMSARQLRRAIYG